MKRMMVFARRNAKEILRDPISMCFGIIFPVVLLALLSLINNAIPEEGNVSIFSIENLAPDITAFGLCFLSLFAPMQQLHAPAADLSPAFLAVHRRLQHSHAAHGTGSKRHLHAGRHPHGS